MTNKRAKICEMAYRITSTNRQEMRGTNFMKVRGHLLDLAIFDGFGIWSKRNINIEKFKVCEMRYLITFTNHQNIW